MQLYCNRSAGEKQPESPLSRGVALRSHGLIGFSMASWRAKQRRGVFRLSDYTPRHAESTLPTGISGFNNLILRATPLSRGDFPCERLPLLIISQRSRQHTNQNALGSMLSSSFLFFDLTPTPPHEWRGAYMQLYL